MAYVALRDHPAQRSVTQSTLSQRSLLQMFPLADLLRRLRRPERFDLNCALRPEMQYQPPGRRLPLPRLRLFILRARIALHRVRG